jgi:nitrogen regulatory protein PII
MRGLKRVEIIANHSVEQDIMDALEQKQLAGYFTKIPSVHGRGNADPKRGDHIWPEENFILIIYCENENASIIENLMEKLREDFPEEGIRCFVTG